MAAELTADLEEGASPEDVLGSDAADARSFAAAWARERGVIPTGSRNGRVMVTVAAVALALATITGVVLMLTASSSGGARLSIQDVPVVAEGSQRVWVGPPLHMISVPTPPVTAPSLRIATENNSGVDWTSVGLALTFVGGIGLAALVAASLWNGALRSRRVALDG